jgi:heat shock protein HslJ
MATFRLHPASRDRMPHGTLPFFHEPLHRMIRPIRFVAVAALVVALAGCATMRDPAPWMLVTGPTAEHAGEPVVLWLWQDTLMNDGARRVPRSPQNYTIRFVGEGRVEVRADCSRGAGRYRAHADGAILIGDFTTPRAACPTGSLDAEFLRDLENARRYSFSDSGELWLGLGRDSGSMRFRAVSG